MSWARLDDSFADHPKVVGLPLEAVGLWTLTLAWAHRHARTGDRQGIIPAPVVARYGGSRGVRLARELVGAGLWVSVDDGGWRIHDFAGYLPREPSHDERVARGRRGGLARAAKARAGRSEAKQDPSSLLDDSQAESKQPAWEVASSGQASPSSRVGLPTEAIPNPNGSSLRSEPPEPVRLSAGAALALVTGDTLPGKPDNRTPGQRLIGDYVKSCRIRPPQRHVDHVAKQVSALLEEGLDVDAVRGGLTLLRERARHPSLLPDLVNEVLNPPTPRRPRESAVERAVLDVLRNTGGAS